MTVQQHSLSFSAEEARALVWLSTRLSAPARPPEPVTFGHEEYGKIQSIEAWR